ncbi:MAG TPA: ferredoxin [Candidatus Nanoarchaeia archaeon]|nr:ferredoxin [Candidatus Nanoarchaeia archaeon]
MKKYRIEFDREACIGAGSCAVLCPENWELVEDGKATVKKIEVDEKEFKCNMEAAESCPVNAIHIIDEETGERLI